MYIDNVNRVYLLFFFFRHLLAGITTTVNIMIRVIMHDCTYDSSEFMILLNFGWVGMTKNND